MAWRTIATQSMYHVKMASTLLPLEIRLRDLATTAADKFPDRNGNYWERYAVLVDFLRTKIYPHINAGLACLSKSPGIYTDHGGQHFDEVVRYAGLLIEPSFEKSSIEAIAPYDLFLLLAGIRLHDAGNIDGREEHERRVYSILKEAGNAVCSDNSEADLIAKIAQAHGGKREDGDKDTIGALQEQSGFGAVACKPRAVAALVRFSDEICEHSFRASSYQIKAETLPPQNVLFHLYANSVKQAMPDRNQKAFRIRLDFDAVHLQKRYPVPQLGAKPPKSQFLFDNALERLQKLDTERRYCNQFLDTMLRTERVDVEISISKTETIGGKDYYRDWKYWSFLIKDIGYPAPSDAWRNGISGASGASIAKMLKNKI
jgi:hypothetical protein